MACACVCFRMRGCGRVGIHRLIEPGHWRGRHSSAWATAAGETECEVGMGVVTLRNGACASTRDRQPVWVLCFSVCLVLCLTPVCLH